MPFSRWSRLKTAFSAYAEMKSTFSPGRAVRAISATWRHSCLGIPLFLFPRVPVAFADKHPASGGFGPHARVCF